MADRWWVNDDADGDWNNANNWSASEGGAGGAGVPGASDNAYFSDTSSPDNCTLSANSTCAQLYMGSANHGGTDDFSGTLAIGVHNLLVTGAFRDSASAAITMGTSADKGLELQGGVCYIYSDWTCAVGAKVTMNGATSISFLSGSSTAGYNVTVRFAQNCTCSMNTASWWARRIYFDSGVTVICPNRFQMNWRNTLSIYLYGTLNATGWAITFSNADIIIASTGEISGDGAISFYANGTANTVVNSKVGAFSFTGRVVTITGTASAQQSIPALDFRHATVELSGSTSTSGVNRCVQSGTLKAKVFEISGTAGQDFTVNHDVTNPSFEIWDEVYFGHAGLSDYTYQRGMGDWKLKNSGAWNEIDFDDKIIEAVTVETGAQKNFIGGFNTRDFAIEGEGKFDSTKAYYCEDISGAGTLRSVDGNQVTIYFRGSNNFTGTLDNVVLEEYPNSQIPRQYPGLRADRMTLVGRFG
jgi:hypothetical protein